VWLLQEAGTPSDELNRRVMVERDDHTRSVAEAKVKNSTAGFSSSPPSIVMIESVGHCNATCPYCPTGRGIVMEGDKRPIERDILDKALQLANKGRANALYLHHRGEPFLHPELDRVVKRVREAGFFAYLSTNLICASEPMIDSVLRAGINQIEIHYSGGRTRLPHEELLRRIHYVRQRNWSIRNNGCRIEVNYGLKEGETSHGILTQLEDCEYYDETMSIRFYQPHDWPALATLSDRGVGCSDCEWFRERCCAVLSDGRLVICCLDQFGFSAQVNVMDIDEVQWDQLQSREICRGCVQRNDDMDWFRLDALEHPSWLQRGVARSDKRSPISI